MARRVRRFAALAEDLAFRQVIERLARQHRNRAAVAGQSLVRELWWISGCPRHSRPGSHGARARFTASGSSTLDGAVKRNARA